MIFHFIFFTIFTILLINILFGKIFVYIFIICYNNINKNNAYEIMKEMWSIDEEIQKLTSDLKKTEQITQRELLERRIDSLYAEFLKYKHLLEDIEVNEL